MGRSFRRKKERWAEPSNQLANAQKQKGSRIHNWGRLMVNRWGQAFPNALGLLMKLWATFCFLWFFDALISLCSNARQKSFCQTCVPSIDWGPTFTYTIFFFFWFSQSNKHNWNTTLLCSSQCGDVIVLKRVNKLIVEIKNIKSQCYIGIYIYIYIAFFGFFWFMWIPTDLQQFLICFPLAHVAYDFWWQWQHHVHQRCPRGPAWFLVLWQNLGSVVANANPN